MTNLEIKKTIKEAIKYQESYKIELILEFGDGSYHPEGTIVYNDMIIYGEDNNELYHDNYGISSDKELFDIPEILKLLRDEQKQMEKYLSKHFKNIIIKEQKG